MRCLSLFSGIGGFDLALQRKGHEIVGACEIDKYAREIYARHFPDVPLHHDATALSPDSLPQSDLLCAGFPCQAFSIAGKRRGFDDTRGTFFFEIVRIAKKKRPRYLLLENVKGLLSHDKGRTFRTILSSLDEVGYDAEWQVLNSKHFVPQNRERVFIVGHLRGERTGQVFPLGEIPEICSNQKETTITNTLTAGGHSGGLHSQMTLISLHSGKIKSRKKTTTLDANYSKGPRSHGERTLVYLSQTNSNMKQREQERDNTCTLTNNCSDFGIKFDSRIRRLTPLECERLQGFPDGWTEGISDTQRYKCLGNAVTVPVVEYVLDAMAEQEARRG